MPIQKGRLKVLSEAFLLIKSDYLQLTPWIWGVSPLPTLNVAFGCAAAGYGNNTVSAIETDRFFYAHADSSGCQFLNIGVGVSGIVWTDFDFFGGICIEAEWQTYNYGYEGQEFFAVH